MIKPRITISFLFHIKHELDISGVIVCRINAEYPFNKMKYYVHFFYFIVIVIKVIAKLNVTYCVIISYASDCCLIVLDTETRINFNLNRNLNEIELSYEKKMFVQKISVILNCVVKKGAMFCSNCILELQTKFFKCFKRICASINLVKCA